MVLLPKRLQQHVRLQKFRSDVLEFDLGIQFQRRRPVRSVQNRACHFGKRDSEGLDLLLLNGDPGRHRMPATSHQMRPANINSLDQ